jgi:hypothetical protein
MEAGAPMQERVREAGAAIAAEDAARAAVGVVAERNAA